MVELHERSIIDIVNYFLNSKNQATDALAGKRLAEYIAKRENTIREAAQMMDTIVERICNRI